MSKTSNAIRPDRAAPSVFHASVTNDVDELRAALAAGESLSQTRGPNGFSALHTAAFNGSADVMAEALQHASADPWVVDRNGRKAIDLAAAGGFREIVGLLYAAMYRDDEDIIRQSGPDFGHLK